MSKQFFKNVVGDAQKLVQIPSTVGDDFGAMASAIYEMYDRLQLQPEVISDSDGKIQAVWAVVKGDKPGPTFMLNACADTATVDQKTLGLWKHDPFSGLLLTADNKPTTIENARILYGRGACDSKIGTAMNAHLAKEMATLKQNMAGNFLILSDFNEHDGTMSGKHAFFKNVVGTSNHPTYEVITYSGNSDLKVGARGIYRLKIEISGKGGHTGEGRFVPLDQRAPYLCSKLVTLLEEADVELNDEWHAGQLGGKGFRIPPGIHAEVDMPCGEFSMRTPMATVNVDFRTTPDYDAMWAEQYVGSIIETFKCEIEQSCSRHGYNSDIRQRVNVVPYAMCAPYETSPDSWLVQSFQTAFLNVTAKSKQANMVVTGPANTGTISKLYGTESVVFGITGDNPHGVNECANLNSLPRTVNVLHKVAQEMLFPDANHAPSLFAIT